MKYEPYKVIEESFRKHMIPGGDLEATWQKYNSDPGRGPTRYKDAEECFESQFHHNMEYFKWYVKGDTGNITFGDSNGPYRPLGLFYGQDAGIPEVQRELTAYVTGCRGHLLVQVAKAMFDIRKERIPVGEIQIIKSWRKLISPNLFGIPVTCHKISKVLSEACYGRFVLIDGLE